MKTQKKTVKQFFDTIASDYSRKRYGTVESTLNYNMVKRKDAILRLLDEIRASGNRLLDAGCGDGAFLADYLLRGFEVYGIDISSEMIDEAKRSGLGYDGGGMVHLSAGDVENLSFPDNHFDVIVCAGVLEYLETDHKAIQELYRVLKPEGVAIITLVNKRSYSNLIRVMTLSPIRKLISPYFPHRASCADLQVRKHVPREFVAAMDANGFSLVRSYRSGFNPIPYNLRLPKIYYLFSEFVEKSLILLRLDSIFGTYVGAFRRKKNEK